MAELDLTAVTSQLVGERLRGPLLYRSQTGSTNDDAGAMAEAGADEGTVLIAGEQRQGRGRKQRAWFGHCDNSLQFSIILRPGLPAEHFPRLVNTIGVAVAEGCAAASGCEVRTKWPNDLIIGGRKLGGILLEANAPHYAIAGIGLNVLGDIADFPPDLRDSATCLQAATAATLTREDVLSSVLSAIDAWYDMLLRGDWADILTRQRALETTLNHDHTIITGDRSINGHVIDLSPGGGLVLQTAAGTRTVTVGEVL